MIKILKIECLEQTLSVKFHKSLEDNYLKSYNRMILEKNYKNMHFFIVNKIFIIRNILITVISTLKFLPS